jgi:hypothetical protein
MFKKIVLSIRAYFQSLHRISLFKKLITNLGVIILVKWLQNRQRNIKKNHTFAHKAWNPRFSTRQLGTGVQYQRDEPNGAKFKTIWWISITQVCHFTQLRHLSRLHYLQPRAQMRLRYKYYQRWNVVSFKILSSNCSCRGTTKRLTTDVLRSGLKARTHKAKWKSYSKIRYIQFVIKSYVR